MPQPWVAEGAEHLRGQWLAAAGVAVGGHLAPGGRLC